MPLLRSVIRSTMLLALLLAARVDGEVRKIFFGLKVGPKGAVWVSGWCRLIVRVMGLQFEVEGPLPEPCQHGLAVVSNHLSYLDVLVMSATQPFIMVAKTEVRSWPLLGWMTAQAGTVYVQRADVKGGQTQTHAEVNAMMADAFRSGLPVLFYPEGTTTTGDGVLPFRRGLFNSVVYGKVPVRAAALSYTQASRNGAMPVGDEVCFVGDAELAPHLFRLLGLTGLRAQVAFGSEPIAGEDRFTLATNSRDAVMKLCKGLRQGRSDRDES